MAGAQTRGRIVGVRKDGLGARLLLLLNCIRVAERMGAGFRLYWPTADGLAPGLHHPERIFSDTFRAAHFLSRKDYDQANAQAAPMWKFLSDPTPDRMAAHLAAGRDILVEEGFEVLSFPWEEADAVRRTCRACFCRIDLAPALQSACERIAAALAASGGASLAYHLRRGDILTAAPWKHTCWPSKIELDELYEIHLERNPGVTALIFSDTPAATGRFKARYPQLRTMGDLVNPEALEALDTVQRDFLELYAMSRADQVIAPTISAFSTAASRIAGRRSMRFHDVLAQEDIKRAHDRAVERLREGSANYLNPSDAAHALSRVAEHMARLGRGADVTGLVGRLKQEGADNAFLDILHTVGHLYSENWRRAAAAARAATRQRHVWPEDFAAARAMEAVALGAQNQRPRAGAALREAFLFKPLRQDVVLCATNVIFRFILNSRNFLPLDAVIQRQIPLTIYEDRGHAYVSGDLLNQRLRRDFRFVTLDWHEMVLDGKASRLPRDRGALARMQARLAGVDPQKVPRDGAACQSISGQLQHLLGETAPGAIALKSAIAKEPDNPLYLKRLAGALERDGDIGGAADLWQEIVTMAPENACYLHGLGRFLERRNAREDSLEFLARATATGNATARVFADHAMAAYRLKRRQTAEEAMQTAIDRIPVFEKFRNQMARIRARP